MREGYKDIYIADIKKRLQGEYIDDDFFLMDYLSLGSTEYKAWRFQCIFVGICLQGSAEFDIDTEKRLVQKNDVIIIIPGQTMDDFQQSPDLKSVGFMLSQEFFAEIGKEVNDLTTLFLFARSHPVAKITDKEAETFTQYFQMLKDKIGDTAHHFRKDVIRMIISTMIYDLGNAIYRILNADHPILTHDYTIFGQFIKLVEEHHCEERRVGWYALKLCISSKYLSEAVRKVSHRSPMEWISNYVTRDIRVLLKTTSMNIKEITQTMNFPNQSALGSYFRQRVGVSPSQYRRS